MSMIVSRVRANAHTSKTSALAAAAIDESDKTIDLNATDAHGHTPLYVM
jgi:hypothetical protein